MSFIRDLEPCRYFGAVGGDLLAVGWLSRGAEFPRGKAPDGFFAKLSALCASSWQPFATGGRHACELCQYEPPSFSNNLFVPYSGRIYVAPAGIRHYVAGHWYLPPAAFIDAVFACPRVDEMAYKHALLSNGGRELARLFAD